MNMDIYRTLIVEDHAIFRQSLIHILSTHFPAMAIAEASNAADAMRQVDGFQPHLVFMDINLPDGNGLRLTKAIKSGDAGIMVIVMTTYDLPEYRNAALQMGASHFMSKNTLNEAALKGLVESAIAAHSRSA